MNVKKERNTKMTIYFDMDGTICNLYANPTWLAQLRAYDPTPYATAKPLVNMSRLARLIRQLQKQGHKVGIISWLSKSSTAEYDRKVTKAKNAWLSQHLPSVSFDEIHIVTYGTPKSTVATDKNGILFDDESNNRLEWNGNAYCEDRIFEILNRIKKENK